MKKLEHDQLIAMYRGFYIFGDTSVLKILFELERFGERTFTELKTELDINPTTLSKKLKLLQEAGLLIAEKNRDNLRVYYRIAAHDRAIRRFIDGLERLSNEI